MNAVKTRVRVLALVLTSDGSTRPRPGGGPVPPGKDLGAAAVDAEALSCIGYQKFCLTLSTLNLGTDDIIV